MADKVKHNVAYGCCGNEGCVGGLPTGTWQVTRCQCEALKPIQIPILECVGVAHLSQHPCPSCGKNVDTYKPSTEWIANAAREIVVFIKSNENARVSLSWPSDVMAIEYISKIIKENVNQ